MRSLAAALLLALGAAACSGGGSSPSVPAAPPGSVVDGASWTPPAHSTSTPQPVTYALVSADGRQVFVRAYGGGCTLAAHLMAIETTTEVRLRSLQWNDSRSGIACPGNLILWTRSVTLSHPLGARKLVDDSTDKAVAFFDGKRLATPTWLPPGAHGPASSPTGRGWWARTYTFNKRQWAPIEIDQVVGNRLKLSELTDASYVRRAIHVRDRRGVLVEQRDAGQPLIQDRLAWFERGYTYIVESSPRWAWQHPLGPATLLRVANGLTLAS